MKDNGIGVPPAMLPHIFDLFAQVEKDLDRSEGGLGIGLTVARSLAEMHGGKVTAVSDGPGKGSEFMLSLPRSRRRREPPGQLNRPGRPGSEPPAPHPHRR